VGGQNIPRCNSEGQPGFSAVCEWPTRFPYPRLAPLMPTDVSSDAQIRKDHGGVKNPAWENGDTAGATGGGEGRAGTRRQRFERGAVA
jgi:hypothetical protein